MSYFPPDTSIITREPSPASTTRGLLDRQRSRTGTYPIPPVPPIPSVPNVPNIPERAFRPTRPIMPGRISSWDSLDDRVRTPVAANTADVPLDTFERMPNGTYRRIGDVPEPTVNVPAHTVGVHVPRYRIGWRTVVQLYGVCVAMATACIAAYNLYSRTHNKPTFSASGKEHEPVI